MRSMFRASCNGVMLIVFFIFGILLIHFFSVMNLGVESILVCEFTNTHPIFVNGVCYR